MLQFAKCTDKSSEYTQQYTGYSADISTEYYVRRMILYLDQQGCLEFRKVPNRNTTHFLHIYVLYLPIVWKTLQAPMLRIRASTLLKKTQVLTPFRERILIKEECLAFLKQKFDSIGVALTLKKPCHETNATGYNSCG